MAEELTAERQRLAERMVSVIRSIHGKGWSEATSTNYSFRDPSEDGERYTFTISRSGVDKESFSEGDFMRLNALGEPLPGYEGVRPSAETMLHVMLYAQYPEARAVLHTHSQAAAVLSMCLSRSKGVSFEGYEMQKALPGVDTHETEAFLPIFPNSQDMVWLSAQVGKALGKRPETAGFLLVGHGLYAWGDSIEAAKRHLEAYEYLLACKLHWKKLGLR